MAGGKKFLKKQERRIQAELDNVKVKAQLKRDLASLDALPHDWTYGSSCFHQDVLVVFKMPLQPFQQDLWPLEKRFCLYAYRATQTQHGETLDGELVKEQITINFHPLSYDKTNSQITQIYYGPTVENVLWQYQTSLNEILNNRMHDHARKELIEYYKTFKIRLVDLASFCGLPPEPLYVSPRKRRSEALQNYLFDLLNEDEPSSSD